MPAHASPTPAIAAQREDNPSVMNCDSSLARAAPSAVRTANPALPRLGAREEARFARLAQAMSSTKATAPRVSQCDADPGDQVGLERDPSAAGGPVDSACVFGAIVAHCVSSARCRRAPDRP
jgi:hypothetical protein